MEKIRPIGYNNMLRYYKMKPHAMSRIKPTIVPI